MVPNREEFPCRCRHEDHATEETWEERYPSKHKCDLAWGLLNEPYFFGPKIGPMVKDWFFNL